MDCKDMNWIEVAQNVWIFGFCYWSQSLLLQRMETVVFICVYNLYFCL